MGEKGNGSKQGWEGEIHSCCEPIFIRRRQAERKGRIWSYSYKYRFEGLRGKFRERRDFLFNLNCIVILFYLTYYDATTNTTPT